MRKALAFAAALVVALSASTSASLADGVQRSTRSNDVTLVHNLSLELVGQVINSPAGVTPATSIQFGYLAYLRGLQIFNSGPQNEATALFTFYTDTTTQRVISNGPLRVITREGTVTIYSDPSANGNFANPDTFRDGTPVLVAGLRQQVIVDTLTGTFTALNLNTIISSSPFAAGKGQLQLGEPGAMFRTVLNGHLNAAAPPSAYMAGYTFSVSDPRPNR